MPPSSFRRYHLAVFNVARMVAPLDSPQLKAFMDGLDPINALGEGAPGFIWRYTADGTNNATAARPMGDLDVIVNFGVWESRDHLWEFVYRSQHLDFLRRRREWFYPALEPYLVLWWVPAGDIPTIEEAVGRLEHLQREGPTPDAFTFREFFEAPAVDASQVALEARS
jgi:uncharacterized protein DUF3291